MKKMVVLTCSFLVIFMAGCGTSNEDLAITTIAQTNEASALTRAPMPTETPAPTNTPIPTDTLPPTRTPTPTKTPNLALTEQAEALQAVLQDFEEKGYITTTQGEVRELMPFIQEWAQMDWFQWWSLDFEEKDFVFKSHFNWASASFTPEDSGCGVVFGIQENRDYYAVFLTSNRILFMMKRGELIYEVGKTRGSGRVKYDNPAEADFIIAVYDQKAFVSVDSDVTEYTLSKDQTTEGQLAFSLLSGTNKDYGTRCEMTDSLIWTPK